MAYSYITNKTTASHMETFLTIRTVLLEAGWEEYDVQSGYTIFRSDGEIPDGKYMYIKLDNTSYSHSFYTNWNSSTHTYVGGAINFSTYSSPSSNLKTYVYADKSGFAIAQSNGATLVNPTILIKADPDFTVETTLINAITSTGTNKVLTVGDNSEFIVGAAYTIFDYNNGKRQPFICTAKGTGTITADSIDTTIAAGSLVGVNVFPVMLFGSGNAQPQIICPHSPSIAGGPLPASATTYAKIAKLDAYNSTSGMYSLMDALDCGAGKLPSKHRYLDIDILECNISAVPYFLHRVGKYTTFKVLPQLTTTNMFLQTQYTDFDVDAIGINLTSTSTGSNTSTIINDTTKSWTVNEFAGKVVVITTGSVTGQVAKIISNTSTSLTVEEMQFIPSTDGYVIANEAYRLINIWSYGWFMFREGV